MQLISRTTRATRALAPDLLLAMTVGLVALIMTVAQPARAADRDKVAAFLEVTGFDVALDSIALSASGAPTMLGLEEDAFGARWTYLADSVFDTALMRARATDILEATLEDDLLAHAAGFYATDLGQRLVAAENHAHFADDDLKEAVGEDLLLDLEAADDPRVDLFQRMSVAIDPNDIGPQAITEIQVRFILAATYAGVIELSVDEDGLRALLAQSAEDMRPEIERAGLRNSAYAYRDFTLDELTEYTEALEHPDMMVVYELMNAVHFEVMSNRFEALALKMGQLQPEQEL